MQVHLIRSATIRLDYADRRILIDPYLAPKHSGPSYAGRSLNPLVDLPCEPMDVIAGIDLTIISHLHSDHFDPTARELLPKETPIVCQPIDEPHIRAMGFQDVTPVADTISWRGVTITRIPCQHGSGEVLKVMGDASGFVLQAKNEPTTYWAGDTIWNETVAGVTARFRPEVIVTHSCGALWGDDVLIVMDAAQTAHVCRAAPESVVVAAHMDSVDHATISRKALREYANAHGIGRGRLLIPSDGERLTF